MPSVPPVAQSEPLRNGPGRPRRGTLARRRDHLLETARELFLEHGLEDVPMAGIARAAGVALRTIYQQYGSRHGLLGALIELEDERHEAQLASLPLQGRPWPEQLAVLALHVAARVRQPGLIRLMAITVGHGDAALATAFERAGPGKVKALLAPIIGEAAGSSPLHGMHDHPQLCDFFIACIAGTRPGTPASSEDAMTCARRGFDLFVRVLDQAPEKRLAFPLAWNASTT